MKVLGAISPPRYPFEVSLFLCITNNFCWFHDKLLSGCRFAASTFLRGGRLSYNNGKSAGKVSPNLRLRGPHNMGGEMFKVCSMFLVPTDLLDKT